MPRAGPKEVQRYSLEFKLTAVRLSQQLAVVMDQCTRRVLAWALGQRRDARLTRAVLDAAVRRRRPPSGLIFHSDPGSEYVAAAFRDRLVTLGCVRAPRAGGRRTTRTWSRSFTR